MKIAANQRARARARGNGSLELADLTRHAPGQPPDGVSVPHRPPATPDPSFVSAITYSLEDIDHFSRLVLGRDLRPYQLAPARAIVDSVIRGRGLTFAVMMARQAGKNELSAQVEAYLLNIYRRQGGQIVKASPTFTPQTTNSMLRLNDHLETACGRPGPGNPNGYRRRQRHIVQVGNARALFFSAGQTANVVGATAGLLLEGDEAQEISNEKWYKDFVPMTASTGATTVLYGTAWTANTLLATTIQHLRRQEQVDGIRRTFVYDAEEVAACIPAYAGHLREQVGLLGRDHPLIRTQYYLETLDDQAGLFPPARRALMRGQHPRRHEPDGGRRYALLLDVAGEEEGGGAVQLSFLSPTRRDATALTVVEVEPRPDGLPLYRVVDRRLWLGVRHTSLFDQIVALAAHWRAGWVVVDATGIGAGLASFLARALPGRVIPAVFTSGFKSQLGWGFVGAVETGRFKDYVDDGQADTRQFWYEVEHCAYEVLPAPGERIRWGVWEPPGYTGLVARGHDDLLVSAALCTVLDEELWPSTGSAEIVRLPDPLEEMDRTPW